MKRRLLPVVDIEDVGAFCEKDPERTGSGATRSVVNWLLVPSVQDIDVGVLGDKLFDNTLVRVDGSKVQRGHICVRLGFLGD